MTTQQKIAVVTGAASGIGLAVASRLVCDGQQVFLADVQSAASQADRLNQDAGEAGGSAHAVAVDITDPDQITALFETVAARHGRLDTLVNVAGISRRGKLDDLDIADIDALLAVNLRGTILCSRAALPLLRQCRGSIVNVASELALIGAPGLQVYCASKGGVMQLTKAMAIDHAGEGIRVNCICPGATLTPMLQESIDSAPDPAARLRALGQTTLLGRVGRPEEIANVICFVASVEASFMTGAIVTVDGGATAA